MPLQPERYPLTPAGRVAVFVLVLALVGAAGMVVFITSSRVEASLLAFPVALGLLTRREFWRKAAIAYAVLQAAFSVGVIAFLLRLAASQPAATATGPGLYAPWDPTFLSIASTTFIVTFAFTVLRQPDVRALFRPFTTATGA